MQILLTWEGGGEVKGHDKGAVFVSPLCPTVLDHVGSDCDNGAVPIAQSAEHFRLNGQDAVRRDCKSTFSERLRLRPSVNNVVTSLLQPPCERR